MCLNHHRGNQVAIGRNDQNWYANVGRPKISANRDLHQKPVQCDYCDKLRLVTSHFLAEP